MNFEVKGEKAVEQTIEMIGHKWRVVDAVPLAYDIWNIGSNMPDGYLPLRRPAYYQPFMGAQEVDTETLCVLPLKDAQKILAVSIFGLNTPKKTEEYVKTHKRGDYKYEEAVEALGVMKSIKWANPNR